jgi:muramoyltetrapeptide carboxypeptidase LdcA involved in peptidoglycan recycling
MGRMVGIKEQGDDIGHKQPNMTLINGALAEATADGQGLGSITQWRI